MGVNTVQVVGPRSEPQEQKKEKRDPLDVIIQGLQLAQGITGVGVNVQSIREKQQNITTTEQKEADAQAGIVDSAGLAGMHEKGFRPVPEGTAGAVPVTHRQGDKSTPLLMAIQPKEEKPTPLQQITTTGPDGKPLIKFVKATEGAAFPGYREPKEPKQAKDITVQERNTLQTQYDRDLSTRKNRMVLEAYDDATSLVKDPSPASDQALIFAYMKSLDPNSVVRESEAESAQALGGMMERAKAWYAKNAGEAGLTDSQRKDLVTQIQKLAGAASKRQDNVDKQFTDLASRRGVDTQDLRFIGRPAIASDEQKAPEKLAAPRPAAPAAPKVGDERKGYVFKGGDPADQNNWVKREAPSLGTATSILERKK